MENKFKITVPKPCHEDWNAMIPSDRGRFCKACTTQVVDFTNMSTDQIRDYLSKNTNVCGRFKNEQLDSVIIQIPKSVIFSQVHFQKMFMLALLISMGTSLFSCQNSDGIKQKIETVEVVEEEPRMTLGIILPPKDSINNKVESYQKRNKEKKNLSRNNIENEKIIEAKDSLRQIIEADYVYGMPGITVYPEYAGGFKMLDKFVKENYIFPKKVNRKEGKIVVSFAVNKTGELEDFKVKNDIGFDAGNILIEVLKKTPKWYPAEFQGKKQIVYYDMELNLINDTIDKFLSKKIIAKIDKIELIRITKFDH
ncbi:hypothetical protein [Flavobacterium chungnamense]|uniref:TonB C-terminal domain-containing protein n=1 Tax=Flavobacterium chungnamense TaxID=706182 RepID=A0ABP7V232_9FLAO